MNIGNIRNLWHHPDARTLAGNFISLSLLKAVGFVFPLITLPYLTRIIGPAKFGELAFASAIMVFIETITEWGFNYTATRDIAQSREDKQTVSQIYSEVQLAKILLMSVCFIGLLIAIYTIPSITEYRRVLIFTFAYIPGRILFPEWFFQAFEQMKYITILNVLANTLFTILIFVVIRKQSDYIYQPLLTACGVIVSGLIATRLIHQKFGIRWFLPSWKRIGHRIRKSSDMFICLILPNFYTNFSTILLKHYCGEIATGLYAAGMRFQQIVDQFTQILSRTFFPFLARHKEKHSIYVKISGAISICACLTLFFGADFLCRIFYSADFADAAKVIKIVSVTPFFLFLMNTYGTNYLVIHGAERILRNIIIGCSIAGFLLTLFLTREWGYIGVAWTMTIIWGIRGIVTYWFAKRNPRNDHETSHCR